MRPVKKGGPPICISNRVRPFMGAVILTVWFDFLSILSPLGCWALLSWAFFYVGKSICTLLLSHLAFFLVAGFSALTLRWAHQCLVGSVVENFTWLDKAQIWVTDSLYISLLELSMFLIPLTCGEILALVLTCLKNIYNLFDKMSSTWCSGILWSPMRWDPKWVWSPMGWLWFQQYELLLKHEL